jgi:hypothetical protein
MLNEATKQLQCFPTANIFVFFGVDMIPAGIISLWSGSIATIPSGWALCDGTNGTPNLLNRFVVCASVDDGGVAKTTIVPDIPTQTGGSIQHGHNVLDPGHSHSATANASAGEDASDCWNSGAPSTTETTGITVEPTTNVPPYFALAYIMKL